MEEERKALWKRYTSARRAADRDALIVEYLHLVKFAVGRVAAGFPSYVKLDDLYSSGVTGLIKAVEKYDASRNSKFESYAILLIKGAIIDELRELDWIPRSIHQKANQVASAQQALHQSLGREPSDEELAQHLGIKTRELDDLLARIRPAILIPLNAEIMSDDEDPSPIAERIADVNAQTSFEVADRKEFQAMLEKAVRDLPEQERRVLMLYYYDELMLKEIGKILGVSESRVSQIHTKALLKLRGRLKGLADEFAQL